MKQLRALLALFVFLALAMPAAAQEPSRGGGRITTVDVRGTQRIDPDTVLTMPDGRPVPLTTGKPIEGIFG